MKRFATLDENNVVTGITTGGDGDTESALTAKTNITHKETFSDRSERKNMASIGGIYDSNRDAFLWPKTFPSWILTEDTCRWDAPVTDPDDGKRYSWNEGTTSWDEVSE